MPTRKQSYAYRYFVAETEAPLQFCPSCHHDLTTPDTGVRIVLYYGDGKSEAGLVEVSSHLDADGRLTDKRGQVAAGYHSTTRCFSCGEQLLDVAHEEQIVAPESLR